MKRYRTLRLLAKGYNHKRIIDRKTLKRIISKMSRSIRPREVVVDLGCGSGRILIPLAKAQDRSVFLGIDVSKEMLRAAPHRIKKEGVKNIVLVSRDFNQCRGMPNRPDVIIMFQSIHFVKNLSKFAKNVGRLLGPGGRIIITTTTHRQFKRLPYCVTFPRVMQLELERTPDIHAIRKAFGRKFKKINLMSVAMRGRFRNRAMARRWLLQKPFSALTAIPYRDLSGGVDAFLTVFKKTKLIDAFDIFTLEKLS